MPDAPGHHPAPVESDALAVSQRDIAHIGRVVRFLSAMGILAAILIGAMAVWLGSGVIAQAGAVIGVVSAVTLWTWDRAKARGPAWFVPRWMALALTAVMLIAAILPELIAVLTAAALIPVAVALPFVTVATLRRLMIMVWVLSVGMAVFTELVPHPSGIPVWALSALRIEAVATVSGILLVLLWYYRGRLSESSRELGGLVTLSRDLAETLDPREIGERLARHLAEATRADSCVISTWDRTRDSVSTFATFPPESLATMGQVYALADFPLTRRVLEQKDPASLHVDDPEADPSEVAILREEGQASLVMLPLVAKGETVGLIELSRDGARFEQRDITLAFTFASEAAMALENARLYQELRHQAFHDGLTRLPNRALFTDRLEHALARSERRGSLLAVLFVDVDDFKTINDGLGHARGDLLLGAIADRLRLCIRSADTAARLGGDEFALLLEDLDGRTEAEAVADRILDVMSRPIQLPDTTVGVGVSIGLCFPGTGGETADELLRNADFAMYRAKTLGKGRVEIFQPGLRAGAAERRRLEGMLHGAIERNELRLEYQPVLDLTNGRLSGLEALLRWEMPDGEVRMPVDFIDMAEETGLIVPIGRWVLREACREARVWQTMTGTSLSIGVNLSARQFQHPALRADVRAALQESGLSPESLVVEITESVLMLNTPGTVATLDAMRRAGVRVAVDDFGTGYSSLSYLQRFPIDILKIDRSFVDGTSRDNGVLARAIVELGRALRMSVVAEGIEDPRQLAALRSFGCRLGQGYLFSRPLRAAEVQQLLLAEERPWDRFWATPQPTADARASRADAGAGLVHGSPAASV
jgi:diguanylate cyclase (GGDEF)-like protein